MSQLEETRLGPAGPSISRIALGCWAFGGHGWGKVDKSQSVEAIRFAYDRGVTFFDTADVYGFGNSELVLKEALGVRLREAVVASKGGVRWEESGKVWNDSSTSYLRTAVEGSLRRLGLERIALYYIHKLDGVTPISAIMECLSKLREEGKIGEIGVSNFSPADLIEALRYASVRAVQNRVNLIDFKSAEELRDLCITNEIKLVSWGTLADGLLTGKFSLDTKFGGDDHRSRLSEFQGKAFLQNLSFVDALKPVASARGLSLSQLALRWVLDSYHFSVALFGSKTKYQVEDNLGACSARLAVDDLDSIRSIRGGIL